MRFGRVTSYNLLCTWTKVKKTRGFGENAKCTARDMDAQEISIFLSKLLAHLSALLQLLKLQKDK